MSKKTPEIHASNFFNWVGAITGIILILWLSIVLLLDNAAPSVKQYSTPEWTMQPLTRGMSEMFWNMCNSKKIVGEQYYGGTKLATNNLYNKTVLICTYSSGEGEVKYFHHCDANHCWTEEAFFPSSDGKHKIAFDMLIYADTLTNGTIYEIGDESDIKDLEGVV